MAQVKKEEIREAILAAAARLIRRDGYSGASLRAIAAEANVSLANIYVYFGSKLQILFALYGPWFDARLARLEVDALAVADRTERLRLVVRTLWRDLPADDDGFSADLMQALALAKPEEGYDPSLVQSAERRIARLLASCLGGRVGDPALRHWAHVMIMAFDGFAINHRLNPQAACSDAAIEAVCSLLLAEAAPA